MLYGQYALATAIIVKPRFAQSIAAKRRSNCKREPAYLLNCDDFLKDCPFERDEANCDRCGEPSPKEQDQPNAHDCQGDPIEVIIIWIEAHGFDQKRYLGNGL